MKKRWVAAMLALAALAVPMVAFVSGHYDHIPTFPFGAYYPASWVWGMRLFWLVLGAAFLGLLIGLAAPRLVLWAGIRSKRAVLTVCLPLVFLACLVREEAMFLADRQMQREQVKISRLMDWIQPGMTSEEAIRAVQMFDLNLRPRYEGISQFQGIEGFPKFQGETPVIFAYPSAYWGNGNSRVWVVDMEGKPGDPQSVVKRVIEVSQRWILRAVPPVSDETEQAYLGRVTVRDGQLLFSPCSGKENFLLHIPASVRPQLGSGELDFIQFMGVIQNAQEAGPRVIDVRSTMRVRTHSKNESEQMMMAVEADGVERPWSCLHG